MGGGQKRTGGKPRPKPKIYQVSITCKQYDYISFRATQLYVNLRPFQMMEEEEEAKTHLACQKLTGSEWPLSTTHTKKDHSSFFFPRYNFNGENYGD